MSTITAKPNKHHRLLWEANFEGTFSQNSNLAVNPKPAAEGNRATQFHQGLLDSHILMQPSTPLTVLDSYTQYQPINFLHQLQQHSNKQQMPKSWQ